MALLIVCVIFPLSGNAGQSGWASFGVRGGYSLTDPHSDFSQYEAYAAYWLPWSWKLPGDARLALRMEGTGGGLYRKGTVGFIGSLGPEIVLELVGGRLYLSGGARAALLSEERFDEYDFGGTFQFITHVGIGVRLEGFVRAGYRFQHMSNAGIYSRNPGLNIHMVELGIDF